MRLSLLAGLATLVPIALAGCPKGPPTPTPAVEDPESKPTPGKPWFEDVSVAAGIDFRHFDCVTPMQYIPENILFYPFSHAGSPGNATNVIVCRERDVGEVQ